jgi:hypothetical protein
MNSAEGKLGVLTSFRMRFSSLNLGLFLQYMTAIVKQRAEQLNVLTL